MFLGRILSWAGTCFETHIGGVLVSQAWLLEQLFWSHVDYCLKVCFLILCPPSLSSVTYLLDSWTNVHVHTANVGRESDPFVSPLSPPSYPLSSVFCALSSPNPPPPPPLLSSVCVILSPPPYPLCPFFLRSCDD